jgi:DNA polymerase-3 subunit alpha
MIAYLFDTETTGLIENHLVPLDRQPHVIEYYGVLTDLITGDDFAEDWFLVRPPTMDVVTEKIQGITSITPLMLQAAQPFPEVADKIKTSLEAAPIVVAHNVSYDVEMVDIEFERLGQSVRWPRKICTIEQTIHVKGHRLTMAGLHEYLFGEKFEGAHRARVDVQALKRCCMEMMRRDLL